MPTLLTCTCLQGPQLRFQLPNERNTYVDLVDDEDVQLMFDEWADYVASPECVSSSKLQVRPLPGSLSLSPQSAALYMHAVHAQPVSSWHLQLLSKACSESLPASRERPVAGVCGLAAHYPSGCRLAPSGAAQGRRRAA